MPGRRIPPDPKQGARALEAFSQQVRNPLERALQQQVGRLASEGYKPFSEMLRYHMGWSTQRKGAKASGKRTRPLITLLVCKAAGGRWQDALHAAVAVELVHNFSLVHDDIQDNSPTRRGRPTVWTMYGIPHAINVGDALFTLASTAALQPRPGQDPKQAYAVALRLQAACLSLTGGQFLDMASEGRSDLQLRHYWKIVDGKTAALIEAATAMGSLCARARPGIVRHFALFGRHLGLAFQVQDDILGVWGDETETGKSAASDLVERKLSLPVVYGLHNNPQFAQRWKLGEINQTAVAELADLLANSGARRFCEKQARKHTELALSHLQQACPRGDASLALRTLSEKLLSRSK